MRKTCLFLMAILFGVFFAACGGGEKQAPAQKPAATADAVPAAAVDDVTEIVISPVGDQMKYATTEFTVKAGQKVRVIMKNVAKLEAMVHNVVICKPGSDTNEIGAAGLQAGEANGYLPETDAILFHTDLAKPGEETSVEFTAPAVGEYPYICTFPGHWTLMNGVMKVIE